MTDSEPQTVPVERKRGRETALDMVRSMGVLAVFVAFILGVTWRPLPSSDPVKPVDAVSIAVASQARASFPLIVMSAPTGWQATSARLDPAPNDESKHVWHIGYVTSTGNYFSVEQTDTALVEEFVKGFTDGRTPNEQVQGTGVTWDVYSKDKAAIFVYQGPEYLILVEADVKSDASLALAALEKAIGSV